MAKLRLLENPNISPQVGHDSPYELVRIAGSFRRILKTELGHEQLCARCDQPWPMDREFYNVSATGGSYECKACVQERKHQQVCKKANNNGLQSDCR